MGAPTAAVPDITTDWGGVPAPLLEDPPPQATKTAAAAGSNTNSIVFFNIKTFHAEKYQAVHFEPEKYFWEALIASSYPSRRGCDT
jgi:hypothetical protein